MAGKSMRDEWKEAKADAARVFDMKSVSDKMRFGPKLDAYEAELKAWEKLSQRLATNPDQAKEDAAKQKVKVAAKAAHQAGQAYLKALQVIEHGSTGATHKAAYDLSTTLADMVNDLTDVATGKKRI